MVAVLLMPTAVRTSLRHDTHKTGVPNLPMRVPLARGPLWPPPYSSGRQHTRVPRRMRHAGAQDSLTAREYLEMLLRRARCVPGVWRCGKTVQVQ